MKRVERRSEPTHHVGHETLPEMQEAGNGLVAFAATSRFLRSQNRPNDSDRGEEAAIAEASRKPFGLWCEIRGSQRSWPCCEQALFLAERPTKVHTTLDHLMTRSIQRAPRDDSTNSAESCPPALADLPASLQTLGAIDKGDPACRSRDVFFAITNWRSAIVTYLSPRQRYAWKHRK